MTDFDMHAAASQGQHPLDVIQLTMSSLEIAGLMGKSHRHVTRDIAKMIADLKLTAQNWAVEYAAENGQKYRCFNLPKRETLILVSGYSTEMRARIIDRWTELEAAIGSKETIAPALAPQIVEVMNLMIAQKVEAALAADPRRAVLDFVSVRQLLDNAKALQKGRKRLNAKLGRELRDAAALSGGSSAARCPHSNVWLFQREFAALFMRERGRELVIQHNERAAGQTVIRFPDRRKNDVAADPGAPA